jgi:hypothetical protein
MRKKIFFGAMPTDERKGTASYYHIYFSNIINGTTNAFKIPAY